MAIITVEDLTYYYTHSATPAANKVSFEIEKGSYTVIVGHNGSGKSTIARLICGLLDCQQGKITRDENYSIGLIFQSPKDQIVSSIVSKDTAFGPQNLKLTKSEIELRTIECLNIVDLLEKSSAATNELSLGQTQKLALAGMLAIWPKVLVLDESVSMLDPTAKKSIFEFLNYWQRHGNTVIHITHELSAVKKAERVIALENGSKIFDGERSEYLAREDLVSKLTGQPIEKVNRSRANSMMAEKPVVFEYDDVSFKYDGKNGIDNVSFKLYKGSITALTGPSGSGKSTILETGAGLLKADSGKIRGRKRADLALQNCGDSIFKSHAADDVAFGPKTQGIKDTELKLKTKVAMDSVNLPFEEYGECRTHHLSSGELRRLAIAGILALDNDVLFFDEPTVGLDGDAKYDLLMLFRNLAEQGKTIVFSTHNKEEAAFADREICIERGSVKSDSFVEKEKSQSVAFEEIKIPKSAYRLEKIRETSRNLSGVKREKKSVLEYVPAFLRLVLFLALFVTNLVHNSVSAFAIMTAVSITYCFFAGFKVRDFLKLVLKILPLLLLVGIIQFIVCSSPSKLWIMSETALKIFASINYICGFFVSTSEHDLIDALDGLFKPLTLLHIRVAKLILFFEVIYRFIPLFVKEAESNIKTQIIRGRLGTSKGKLPGFFAMIPLFVPVFVRTVKSSRKLVDAIIMRAFK